MKTPIIDAKETINVLINRQFHSCKSCPNLEFPTGELRVSYQETDSNLPSYRQKLPQLVQAEYVLSGRKKCV